MSSSQVRVLPANYDEGREGQENWDYLQELTIVIVVGTTTGSSKSIVLFFLGTWLDYISQIPLQLDVTIWLARANGMGTEDRSVLHSTNIDKTC